MGRIPKEATRPKEALEDHTIFVHGPPKIGKSTLAAQFTEPIFIATEAGLNSLTTFQVPIMDEVDGNGKIKKYARDIFVETLTELVVGKHSFRTLVIDTVNNLAEYCIQYVYAKNRIQHASDFDWGKGWQLLDDEAAYIIKLIGSMPMGKIFISHSEEKEIRRKNGTSYTKITDNLPKQFKHRLHALSDIILYATMEDGKPVLKTRESDEYLAGNRVGLPETLPFLQPPGKPSLAYEQFVEAFYAAKNGSAPKREAGKKTLLDKILVGEAWLAEHKVDNFDTDKRVMNSRKKHMQTENLKDASVSALERYFQHLRQKAKEGKNGDVPKNG